MLVLGVLQTALVDQRRGPRREEARSSLGGVRAHRGWAWGAGGDAPWPAGTYVHGLGDHSCRARNILASKLGNQIFSFVFKRERRKPPHLYTEAVPRAGGRREVPGI